MENEMMSFSLPGCQNWKIGILLLIQIFPYILNRCTTVNITQLTSHTIFLIHTIFLVHSFLYMNGKKSFLNIFNHFFVKSYESNIITEAKSNGYPSFVGLHSLCLWKKCLKSSLIAYQFTLMYSSLSGRWTSLTNPSSVKTEINYS